jgi:hypothetical protein
MTPARGIGDLGGRKSPQKRPVWRPTGNARFARAGWRPTTQSSNRSPLERGTEIFDAETNSQTEPSAKQRPPAETHGGAKNPHFGAINAKRLMKVSTQGLGGGGSSRAKPVSKAGTGIFLKIPGQNRLSERCRQPATGNSGVIQGSCSIAQALSCYSAKQALEA